jgi:leucyl aminopeptidase
VKFQIVSKIKANTDAIIYLVDANAKQEESGSVEPINAHISWLLDKDKTGLFAVGSKNKSLVYTFITKKTAADFDEKEALRKETVSLTDECAKVQAKQITLVADSSFPKSAFLIMLEAMALSDYSFNKYKTKTPTHSIAKVEILQPAINKDDLKRLDARLDAVNYAKDIVNTPNMDLGVKELGKHLKKEADKLGIEFKSLKKSEIERLKMGGLLGVNAGSPDDPGFFVLTYKPKNAVNKKPLVLVGKGVVYDTGGYSLKPSASMLTMKADMAGAAAASGSLFAIAGNEHPVYAICIIPATDNRVEKKAIVPDDVLTISNGLTVEVQNTDAEGRLILADALVYAQKFNPELVIDFATLTGAAAYLTGYFSSAFFSTADKEITDTMIEASEETYERLIQLPLWQEYDDMLKSSIADIRNIGGRVGGMITAAKFLQHFVDFPWMHIDIAGPAYLDAKEGYRSNGATGVGVRLIEQFVAKWLVK